MRDIQQEPGTVLATKKVLASHQPCTAVADPVSAGGRVEKSTFFAIKSNRIWPHLTVHTSSSQSMIPLPHPIGITQNLLEMLNLRPHYRPTESEILGMWPSNLYF